LFAIQSFLKKKKKNKKNHQNKQKKWKFSKTLLVLFSSQTSNRLKHKKERKTNKERKTKLKGVLLLCFLKAMTIVFTIVGRREKPLFEIEVKDKSGFCQNKKKKKKKTKEVVSLSLSSLYVLFAHNFCVFSIIDTDCVLLNTHKRVETPFSCYISSISLWSSDWWFVSGVWHGFVVQNNKSREENTLNHFIVHSALDLVDELVWKNSSMYVTSIRKKEKKMTTSIVVAYPVSHSLSFVISLLID